MTLSPERTKQFCLSFFVSSCIGLPPHRLFSLPFLVSFKLYQLLGIHPEAKTHLD